MKLRELIIKLLTFDPNLDVIIDCPDEYYSGAPDRITTGFYGPGNWIDDEVWEERGINIPCVRIHTQ